MEPEEISLPRNVIFVKQETKCAACLEQEYRAQFSERPTEFVVLQEGQMYDEELLIYLAHEYDFVIVIWKNDGDCENEPCAKLA